MEYRFKIILIGDYSSGKTAIIKKLSDEPFFGNYTSTIGVDYIKKKLHHNDIFNDTTIFDDGKTTYEITSEETIKFFKPKNPIFKKYHQLKKRTTRDNISYNLAIWDTSGQEQFSKITSAYYRNITSAILVFDLTNYKSFKSIEIWHRNLFDKLNSDAHAYFPFIIVGNKSDMRSLRTVSTEEAEELAAKLGGIYVETSAKDNQNINTLFSVLIKAILFNINHELVVPSNKNGISVEYYNENIFPRKDILEDNEESITQKCCGIM